MIAAVLRRAFLSLLSLALFTSVPTSLSAQDPDPYRPAIAGRKLSAEAARELEAQVQSSPDDVEARSKLLGYYFLRAHTSEEARAARQQHILWLIRNRPETPILETPFAGLDPILESSAYEEGKKAWLEQVERDPKNAAILGRAALYLLLHDPALAEGLYKRAEAAEPANPKWPERLGELYALGLSSKADEDRQRSAKSAMDAYERSVDRMQDDEHRLARLPDLAKAALEAGDLAKAREYAEESLKVTGDSTREFGNYGDVVHHAHLILGRLALRAGDVQQAKEHLLAAGRTPGSPPLNSFGPNMTLAKELLEKGERQAVLDYFELCGAFWKKDQLAVWAKEVQAGRIPDFGANLDY
jgi:tetratricopeptide (TPR) repeat protein